MHHGDAIKAGRAFFGGRLQYVGPDSVTVTLDRLSSEKQSSRSLFGFTHVADIAFDRPRPLEDFESQATMLFRVLSLMRGRWVGLLGPWLYVDHTLQTI